MKNYLNALGFARWLEERAGDERIQRARRADPSFGRRLHSWRNGGPHATASYYTVSAFLTRLFQSIGEWEIPEELFTDRNRPAENYTDKDRSRAVKMLGEGGTPTEIAAEIGCSIDSVFKWARAAGVTRPTLTESAKQEAVERVLLGEPSTRVAADVGWNPRSLQMRVRKAKARRVAA